LDKSRAVLIYPGVESLGARAFREELIIVLEKPPQWKSA
jgi:hypothetical protein